MLTSGAGGRVVGAGPARLLRARHRQRHVAQVVTGRLERLGGPRRRLDGAPAAVSWGTGPHRLLRCRARTTRCGTSGTTGGWSGWEGLGGVLTLGARGRVVGVGPARRVRRAAPTATCGTSGGTDGWTRLGEPRRRSSTAPRRPSPGARTGSTCFVARHGQRHVAQLVGARADRAAALQDPDRADTFAIHRWSHRMRRSTTRAASQVAARLDREPQPPLLNDLDVGALHAGHDDGRAESALREPQQRRRQRRRRLLRALDGARRSTAAPHIPPGSPGAAVASGRDPVDARPRGRPRARPLPREQQRPAHDRQRHVQHHEPAARPRRHRAHDDEQQRVHAGSEEARHGRDDGAGPGRLDPGGARLRKATKLGPDAIPHLQALVNGDDAMLASKAAYLASLIKSDASADVVRDAARSNVETVRVAAAAAARNLPSAKASAVLEELIADVDPGVRKVARDAVPRRPSSRLAGLLEETKQDRGGRMTDNRDLHSDEPDDAGRNRPRDDGGRGNWFDARGDRVHDAR